MTIAAPEQGWVAQCTFTGARSHFMGFDQNLGSTVYILNEGIHRHPLAT